MIDYIMLKRRCAFKGRQCEEFAYFPQERDEKIDFPLCIYTRHLSLEPNPGPD